MAAPARPARAGISLDPVSSAAVLIGDRTVWLPRVAAGPRDLEYLIQAVCAAAGRALEAVTLDLSRVLLDAIVRDADTLPRVAVIRVVPRAATNPALASSPADLVERLIAHRFTVAGGHDLLGNELCPLDVLGVQQVCAVLGERELLDVAVVGAGSQARPVHEREVAEAIQAALPQARISVASDFGGHGLVAREATVVLDRALAPLVGRLVQRAERALAAAAPCVPLRVTRGDGGHTTPSRSRALPVVALGADDALQVSGAAHLAGEADCRVLLPRPTGQVAGDVRHGLVAVASGHTAASLGVDLVVPTAVLTPDLGTDVVDELRRTVDAPVVVAHSEPIELACLGAAVSTPTAWLDEFAFIESAERLELLQQRVRERANAIVMANGAAPGTAFLVEVSMVAVPYSPPGTVRVRVRMAGAPDIDPRRIAVGDRMAP